MVVTEEGILTDDSLVQPLKAPPSMVVTEEGIVTELRLVQP